MRILITGGRGQLAADLTGVFAGEDVVAVGRDRLDITVPEQVRQALDTWGPRVVINTAAFHNVDRCEDEPEQSFAVNAAAPQRLAAACRETGALFVHISTDYVFDGWKGEPYTETDPVHPLSVYGASKAAGEMAVRSTTDRHLIVRTTGLYGPGGKGTARGNFVETMLRLAAVGTSPTVVSDQVLTPSYTVDVANAIKQLIEDDATGTFHVTNAGQCSWYDFACEIFRLAKSPIDVAPTTQAERPTPARRPSYSVLAHTAMYDAGLPPMHSWHEALRSYMTQR